MNSGKQHMDEELLIRFIIGEANDHERIMAQKWINQSDDNKIHFEKLLKTWSAAEDLRKAEPADVNTDAAWKKLKDRIDQFHEIETNHLPSSNLGQGRIRKAAPSSCFAFPCAHSSLKIHLRRGSHLMLQARLNSHPLR